MSDDLGLRKQLEQGSRAKTVLESEAFQSAFGGVKAAIIEAWEQCPIRDRDGAHELKLMLKLMSDIEGHLKKAVEQGKFAAEELKRDRTFSQRLADRLRIA